MDLALGQHELWNRRIHWRNTAAGQRRGDVEMVLTEGMIFALIEADSGGFDSFAHRRRAAADWNGSKPIRG